jgi:hypothetical protein
MTAFCPCSLKLCLGVLERLAIVKLTPKSGAGHEILGETEIDLLQVIAPPEHLTAVCWACFFKPHTSQ